MLMAPVNPADLDVIAGSYGRLPVLPAVLGNEGVGEVVALGPGVADLEPGQRVRPREGVGTWCQLLCAPRERLQPLPFGPSPEQAAQLAVNPATAWAVLTSFPQPPGSWVLLNGATSALGHSWIAVARSRGLHVAALVRRPEAQAEVLALGADCVVVEGREAASQLREACGPQRAGLALNMVGGDSAATLAKALAPDGFLVCVGAMSRRALSLGNGPLIFGELRVQGFWLSRWYDRTPAATLTTMYAELSELLVAGQLELPVAGRFALGAWREAFALVAQPGRGGKVLFDCQA